MSDADPVFKDIADNLADLARRLASVEAAQEALARGLGHERDMQRQTLGLLVQLLERQNDSLKRVEAKLHETAVPTAEPPAPKRQAVVKGQVLVAKPKPAAKPKARVKDETPGDEIDQQISEAIGNISAMLKKQSSRKRKG